MTDNQLESGHRVSNVSDPSDVTDCLVWKKVIHAIESYTRQLPFLLENCNTL